MKNLYSVALFLSLAGQPSLSLFAAEVTDLNKDLMESRTQASRWIPVHFGAWSAGFLYKGSHSKVFIKQIAFEKTKKGEKAYLDEKLLNLIKIEKQRSAHPELKVAALLDSYYVMQKERSQALDCLYLHSEYMPGLPYFKDGRKEEWARIFDNKYKVFARLVPLVNTLAFIHDTCNVAHEDIKMSSILVSEDGSDWKLTSFGFPAVRNREGSHIDNSHVAPEGRTGGLQDETLTIDQKKKADVYSMAILIGTLLLDEDDPRLSAWKSRSRNYGEVCLRHVRPFNEHDEIKGVPPKLLRGIIKCWSANPDERMTAREFFEFLSPFEKKWPLG